MNRFNRGTFYGIENVFYDTVFVDTYYCTFLKTTYLDNPNGEAYVNYRLQLISMYSYRFINCKQHGCKIFTVGKAGFRVERELMANLCTFGSC